MKMHNNFSSLNITFLTSYLECKKWVLSSSKENQYNIWHRPEEDFYDFEVVQPLNTSIASYNQRIYELLNILSQFEKRDINTIFNDINNFNYDILKIRVVGTEVNAGHINLNDGVLLFEKVKNMIFSIIHSTVSKKGFYKNLSSIPTSLQTYCQSLKFGQTEHGSYIVNVLAPHNDIRDTNNPIQQDITSSVSENINCSLMALSKALECYKRNNSTKFFLESINSGVSANLCDSIIGMSGKNESYDVEITISSKILHQSFRHEFKSENIKYLKIATEYLKGHSVLENYAVVGKVITLNKQPDEETGSVTIKFDYDKHTKNIKLQLPDADYLEAVKAHANKSTVSIKGDLVIDGKKTNLINFGKLKITNQNQLLLQ